MTGKRAPVAFGIVIGLMCVGRVAGAERLGAQATVAFPDKQAARAAILDDALEPYFEQLQPMEMSARTGRPIAGTALAAQCAECRRRHQAAVPALRLAGAANTWRSVRPAVRRGRGFMVKPD